MSAQPPTVPLFPEPARAVLELSRMWSGADLRIPSGTPQYTTLKLKSMPDCDECWTRQLETKGESGYRNPSRVKRHLVKKPGTTLHLCRGHEELWRQRDDDDARRKERS